MFDGKAFGAEIVGVVKAHVERNVAPLLAEVAALRGEIAALKAAQVDPDDLDSRLKTFSAIMKDERDTARAEGKEKRKAALAELKAGLLADCETMMSSKIADLPAPLNGKDADAEAVAAIVSADVRKDIDALRGFIEALPTIPELPDIPALISKAVDESEAKALADRVLLTEAIVNVEVGYKQAIADIPAPTIIPDIPAMIADAIEAAKPEPVDYIVIGEMIDSAAKAQIEIAIAAIPAPLPHPELPDIPSMIAEAIVASEVKTLVQVVGVVEDAVAAIPAAENGKDADPELVASLVKETVERAVAAIPAPKNGEAGSDGVTLDELLPVIGQEVAKAVSAIPIPKDGLDAVEFFRAENGHLIVTMSNGTTRDLGQYIGKDGADGTNGKDGLDAFIETPDVDLAAVTKMIEDAVAKHTVEPLEFAPDEVAANVSLTVKMMAETPQAVSTLQRSEAQPINNFSITMPEMKAADTTVNVSLPEQHPPVVTVEPSVVNVAPANVHVEMKRGKEVTKVTGWDKNGRITSFEKTETD